ncbi:hypothetical protein [Pasteuria penetrans]|uniref:hypothetical protein n=1 Tax=Pasteuria penetrans TaxID=86005 RepID=UPI0011EE4A57|nr:hypothetical protein [Pasteuria penetrans]
MVELEEGGTDDFYKYSSEINGGRFRREGFCDYACAGATGAGSYWVDYGVSQIHPVTKPFAYYVGMGVGGLTGVGSTYVCNRFCS